MKRIWNLIQFHSRSHNIQGFSLAFIISTIFFCLTVSYRARGIFTFSRELKKPRKLDVYRRNGRCEKKLLQLCQPQSIILSNLGRAFGVSIRAILANGS